MQYDGDLKLPGNYLVPPPEISRVSGRYLCASGVRTFACSETQKFGHVTFFWNGNRSGYFDQKLETYIEVPCPVLPALRAPGRWLLCLQCLLCLVLHSGACAACWAPHCLGACPVMRKQSAGQPAAPPIWIGGPYGPLPYVHTRPRSGKL